MCIVWLNDVVSKRNHWAGSQAGSRLKINLPRIPTKIEYRSKEERAARVVSTSFCDGEACGHITTTVLRVRFLG